MLVPDPWKLRPVPGAPCARAGAATQHLRHSEQAASTSLGTLSLPANGDPRGRLLSQEAALTLSVVSRAPRAPPGATQAERPLSPSWPAPGPCPGCGAGVGFRPLGRWGRMWARPRLPAHRPPSRARSLGRPRPASGHRTRALLTGRAPLARPAPGDSLLPWPAATAVSWQEAGTGLCRSHGAWCARAAQRRVRSCSGRLPEAARRQPGRWLRLPVAFLLPTMKKEVT